MAIKGYNTYYKTKRKSRKNLKKHTKKNLKKRTKKKTLRKRKTRKHRGGAHLKCSESNIQIRKETSISNYVNNFLKCGIPLKDCCFAFDFDLTLTMKEKNTGKLVTRGGKDTLNTLNKLKKGGAQLLIVTATSPSAMNYETILSNMKTIKVDKIFDANPSNMGKMVDIGEGIKIFDNNNVILAKYNKPEALVWKTKKPVVVFFDDFMGNTSQVAEHFLNEKNRKNIKSVVSVWLDPSELEKSGKIGKLAENSNNPELGLVPYIKAIEKCPLCFNTVDELRDELMKHSTGGALNNQRAVRRKSPKINFEGIRGEDLRPKQEEIIYAELDLKKPPQKKNKEDYIPVSNLNPPTIYATVKGTTTDGSFKN